MEIKTRRTFSGEANYHKFEIACGQLETAIHLFLTDGADMFSAITLGAAAAELLHRLVLNAGKEPFVDGVVQIEANRRGQTPKRGEIISAMHRIQFVNALKHFDKDDPDIVTFNAELCAIAVIVPAIQDFQTFTGSITKSMQAMVRWTTKHVSTWKDGKEIGWSEPLG